MDRDKRTEELLKAICYQGGPEARDRILGRAYEAMDQNSKPGPDTVRPGIWRIAMNGRNMRIAAVAAAVFIVLGGVTFWPFGSADKGQWWLGPPAAWGQEILDSLDSVEAVVYRQRSGYSSDYGPAQMNVGWERRYNAQDGYRRDRYDDGLHIMNTQWVLADGNEVSMVEVSYEYECYFARRNERYGFGEDFLGHLRSYVQLLDRADRMLGTEVFDGRECVGFEVSAAKYGDNAQGRFDRIWLDTETRLPARIERHGIPLEYDAGRTLVLIHDQFEYYAIVPADLFVPVIPDGFVNAHPDEVRAARDGAIKGQMATADVPEGLEETLVSALKAIEAGSFREGHDLIRFSRNAWRRDAYSNADLRQSHWYGLGTEQFDGPFEPQGDVAVTETGVDFQERTFRVTEHSPSSAPRHPMRRILFVVGLLSRADHFYEHEVIDGVTCFGFDVSAAKYGDNPPGALHSIWFDAATNLPVRIEAVWPHRDSTGTSTKVTSQFVWNPDLPTHVFTAQIPDGFTPAAD